MLLHFNPQRRTFMQPATPNATDTKARILAAACDIYLEGGSKGLSMRRVASRVGLTPTAIYRYFDSKESLHQQVLQEGFRAFASYLLPARQGLTPIDRLHRAADAFFQFAIEQARYYELLFLSMDVIKEEKVRRILRKEARTTFDFMIERVKECMLSGDLKPDDPEEIAMLLLSVCNGFFGLYVSQKFTGTAQSMKAKYDRTYQRLLQGLAV